MDCTANASLLNENKIKIRKLLVPGVRYIAYTVISILAFLYQVNNGFSPLLVSVSSMYAHRRTKSSWLMTWVNFPVTAR